MDNARANGVEVYQGDLCSPLPDDLRGQLDVVVAVVPYVPTAALTLLPRDTLTFEDVAHYDGGPDGTVAARTTGRRGPGLAPARGAAPPRAGGRSGRAPDARYWTSWATAASRAGPTRKATSEVSRPSSADTAAARTAARTVPDRARVGSGSAPGEDQSHGAAVDDIASADHGPGIRRATCAAPRPRRTRGTTTGSGRDSSSCW